MLIANHIPLTPAMTIFSANGASATHWLKLRTCAVVPVDVKSPAWMSTWKSGEEKRLEHQKIDRIKVQKKQ